MSTDRAPSSRLEQIHNIEYYGVRLSSNLDIAAYESVEFQQSLFMARYSLCLQQEPLVKNRQYVDGLQELAAREDSIKKDISAVRQLDDSVHRLTRAEHNQYPLLAKLDYLFKTLVIFDVSNERDLTDEQASMIVKLRSMVLRMQKRTIRSTETLDNPGIETAIAMVRDQLKDCLGSQEKRTEIPTMIDNECWQLLAHYFQLREAQ